MKQSNYENYSLTFLEKYSIHTEKNIVLFMGFHLKNLYSYSLNNIQNVRGRFVPVNNFFKLILET